MVKWILVLSVCFVLPAYARDLGTHGTVFPIAEADPVTCIQTKLKALSESGDLEKHIQSIQETAKASVLHPASVTGITKATKSRIFYYDPTFVVEHDFKDHTGKIFASKGSRLNPLEKISLSSELIFFDGDDPEQVDWVTTQLTSAPKGSVKLILINGSPLSLSETFGQAVYEDQNGLLTRKLGMTHSPARVSQEGLLLRIEEIPPLKDSKRPHVDRASVVPHKEIKR